MTIQNQLMNPTPFEVEIDYERGIVIKVPAFGSTSLTMQQMDDFRDGKPGSENVQENLNWYGVFIMDADRPYNNQAIDALSRCIRARKERLRGVIDEFRKKAAESPGGGGADIEEQLKVQGFDKLRDGIELLEKQLSFYRDNTTEEKVVAQSFDPERTILVTNPPTEFPSKEAMEFFLNLPENAEIKAKHEEVTKGE